MEFLIERPDFVRDPKRTLHSYMLELDILEHVDRYHPHNLFNINSLWSGHVAIINYPFADGDFRYIHLFDKFLRASTEIGPEDERMLHITVFNNIMPITSDGRIIYV